MYPPQYYNLPPIDPTAFGGLPQGPQGGPPPPQPQPQGGPQGQPPMDMNKYLIDKVMEIMDRCPTLETLVYNDPRGMRHYDMPFLHAYKDVQEKGRAYAEANHDFYESRVAASKGGDLAIILYTSGSTGVPKGVMLTHGAVSFQTVSQKKALLFGPDERCLLAVPMFHAASLVSCVFPILQCGATTIIQKDVNVAEMIRAIERERCTFTSGVPAMYKMMLLEDELLATTDCSSLRFALCGSSEVPEDLLEEFTRRLAPMLEIYGMTENGPVCCNPRWGITKQGTTGLPYPGVELRIVDPSNPGSDVPPGEMGELLIRTPGNVSGYHNLPDVTKERILDGGWLRSRDIARADADGYIEIVGREDDRISCAGESIYPKEVENVLMKHPDIADVAAVAMSDDIKGEVPVAFVIEKTAGRTNAEDLKQYFLANGAAYMHPRRAFLVDEMPLTSASKLDRSALREMAEKARMGGGFS